MPPRSMRPLVERLQEIGPRLRLFLARRVNRIERDDVAVPRVRQQRAAVLVDEVRPERHVAAKAVLLVVGVGPLHVVLEVLDVVGARERPEGEGIARRPRGLRVVDGLVGRVEREAAAGAQQAVEAELEAGPEPLLDRCRRSSRRDVRACRARRRPQGSSSRSRRASASHSCFSSVALLRV